MEGEYDQTENVEPYSTELRINRQIAKLKANAKLEKWLKQISDYSCSPFDGLNYSDYYKSYFGNVSNDGIIYDTSTGSNDIDVKLNIGYCRYPPGIEKNPEDKIVEQFIDTVVDDNGVVMDIVIPPGTNQSNANFLFKLFSDMIGDMTPTNVPIVSSDHTARYTGGVKQLRFTLPKNDLYQFLMDRSNQSKKYF